METKITITGAKEHNLKNINLQIPRDKMIVFTGLSGSGKSSLAFDTIFAEGQRRYIESLSAYARQFLGGLQKPNVDEITGLSPAISIDQKAHSANPRSTVATITEIYDYLRILLAKIGTPHCPNDGTKLQRTTTQEMTEIIFKKIKTFADNSNNELKILAPVVRGRKGEYYQLLYDVYNSGYLEARVDGKIKSLRNRIQLTKNKKHTIEIIVDKAWVDEFLVEDMKKGTEQRLAEAVEKAVDLSNGLCTIIFPDGQEETYSTEYTCPEDGYSFPEIEPRLFSFNSPYGYCGYCTGLGTKELFSDEVCPECDGKRLNNDALSVRINKKNIWEISDLSIKEARKFFDETINKLTDQELAIAELVINEIENRLRFMFDVGLHYLTLNRKSGTLSGGEAQRIRLASQVGQRLVGAMYVLDEPTIGLHQKDNEKLVKTLRNLCDIGNTIIVVEHDEDTILSSDWIVDIGPGAGKHGGEIVFSGPLENILDERKALPKTALDCKTSGKAAESLTGKYLRGEEKIPTPKQRRKVDKTTLNIKIVGAEENNLKKINVNIPLKRFVCLTGVSGSGKSSLMNDILYKAVMNKLWRMKKPVGKHKSIEGIENIDKTIRIDQSPIGRTPRSNPATYTGAWTHIRDLFAATQEARIRGYKPGRFSFNRPGGRCEACEGRGVKEIEMHFLPSVQVICEVCRGKRFNKETLQVHYKGLDISEVLAMTIEEAEVFFKDIPGINSKLKILNEVGLDYLTVGQSAKTLSGGEAQRIKLSKELAKRNTTKTLYLLDEPTTGLHYDDVKKLIEVLQRLTGQGNTVMVIEHNLDVIKNADWIIDLGPGGGDEGGELIAEGTPEEVAIKSSSYTGKYLKPYLKT
ncbi:excinuclease ABC subunit A [Candidatus Falkowbacteria bacterium CG10_big_fil_rev_8_21_14_0_10_39_11]|uniref:UvrABC system protein A n=1 Tax=Candidatus Falkowbacteria bacterium CG10_big_fil_rev_8_21_14_0_10_39_11 TaxID=1974565 RepID=A0A2H0V3N6_9BACT|nr:MAG: excinuclease ABC subunit A [Candidatus Falkowbacteria bacterium CG10_big_fil_rev_8_21_14_0_10_39_11]